ncbi:MAG: hypothetical protein HGA96_02140 [Desulfobulbaceae bacterium]|nr:hypothetical protein [Desulfobulbaceae bacterium]
MRKCLAALFIVSCGLLSGCIVSQMEAISKSLALPEATVTPAPRARVAPELAPPVAEPAKSAEIQLTPDRLFSVSFSEADLSEVLALVSRESGVPIVARSGVAGKVTADIENRSLGEILYAILEPLGLRARVEGGMIMVDAPHLVSQTFQVSYINNKRASTSTTNASVSSGSSSTSTSSNSSSTSVSSSTTSGNTGGQGNVSVSTTGTTDFWPAIKSGLEAIVFGAGGRKESAGKQLVINEMAGVIYVTDYADNMAEVSRYLAEVENAIKRQVLIQAHIVEVTFNDSYALGIDWNYIFNESGRDWGLSQTLSLSPSKFFQLDLKAGDFTALLDAMQTVGKVNMMSSPKISTLNNQKAVIKLTTKEVTWITETIISGTSGTTQTSVNPQIDEVGLFLDVTPSISEENRVTLQIHPSISEIVETSYSPSLGADKPRSSKPVINVREVDTLADVQSGQTVVIAGLISDRFQNTRSSVPLLGDIPLIGNIFSHLAQEKKKVELVIFLTPYVVDQQLSDRIRQGHEQRLEQIRDINHLSDLTAQFKMF